MEKLEQKIEQYLNNINLNEYFTQESFISLLNNKDLTSLEISNLLNFNKGRNDKPVLDWKNADEIKNSIILSNDPNMTCFIIKQNKGYKIFKIFKNGKFEDFEIPYSSNSLNKIL